MTYSSKPFKHVGGLLETCPTPHHVRGLLSLSSRVLGSMD